MRGVGYNVRELRQYIVEILGLDRERRLVIVGAGNLGTALCHYSGFSGGSFLVVGVLDSDPNRIGDPTPAGLLVEDAVTARRDRPPAASRDRCDHDPPGSRPERSATRWSRPGFEPILNFAPIRVRAPEDVLVKTVDLKVHLEELSFHITHSPSTAV